MGVSPFLSTCNGKPYKLGGSYHKIMGLVMGLPFDPDQSDDEDEERPTKRRKTRRKISFAPKAFERQFSRGGTITKESTVPTKLPVIDKTKAQMEQSKRDRDIKYVFIHVLALWAQNQNTLWVDEWIDTKNEERILKEMKKGRPRDKIFKSTKEDLKKICNRVVREMEESGLDLTLKGDAGRMIIYQDPSNPRLTLKILKELQRYLIRETIFLKL